MRPAYQPQTTVPGATLITDKNGVPQKDKRGRPLWNMPDPAGYVEHTKWRKHKKTGKRIPEPVQVPYYKGMSARLYGYMRSQYKRLQRKMEATSKIKEAATKVKSHAVEAGNFLRDLVLNPLGQDKEEENE
jgi:hypothetical protein